MRRATLAVGESGTQQDSPEPGGHPTQSTKDMTETAICRPSICAALYLKDQLYAVPKAFPTERNPDRRRLLRISAERYDQLLSSSSPP